MHTCKQMILQYTIVKPILAGLTIFLELRGSFHEGDFSPKVSELTLLLHLEHLCLPSPSYHDSMATYTSV